MYLYCVFFVLMFEMISGNDLLILELWLLIKIHHFHPDS